MSTKIHQSKLEKNYIPYFEGIVVGINNKGISGTESRCVSVASKL